MGKRAVDYRREFKITPDKANGTAVNVVTMVFGNLGYDCATGESWDFGLKIGLHGLHGLDQVWTPLPPDALPVARAIFS